MLQLGNLGSITEITKFCLLSVFHINYYNDGGH